MTSWRGTRRSTSGGRVCPASRVPPIASQNRFNREWWVDDEGFFALAMDRDKRLVRAVTSNVGHCLATAIIDTVHLHPVVGRLFATDMISKWCIHTLSPSHAFYNALSYPR